MGTQRTRKKRSDWSKNPEKSCTAADFVAHLAAASLVTSATRTSALIKPRETRRDDRGTMTDPQAAQQNAVQPQLCWHCMPLHCPPVLFPSSDGNYVSVISMHDVE